MDDFDFNADLADLSYLTSYLTPDQLQAPFSNATYSNNNILSNGGLDLPDWSPLYNDLDSFDYDLLPPLATAPIYEQDNVTHNLPVAFPLVERASDQDVDMQNPVALMRDVDQESLPKTLKCKFYGCTFSHNQSYEVRDHKRKEHGDFLSCDQCGEHFFTAQALSSHARSQDHAAHSCEVEECDSTFIRYQDLVRHQGQHRADVQRFPCDYCRKHRGPQAFKRKDHLTQHLRNYHHFELEESSYSNFMASADAHCPHLDCAQHRTRQDDTRYYWNPGLDGKPPFSKRSDFTEHMKKVHDESLFPCKKAGCDRIGKKGYFRKRDLDKHCRAKHPESVGLDLAVE